MSVTILMIDDEVDFADTTRDRLCHHGYDVDVCHDGHDGLDAFDRKAEDGEPYDLVLLDVQMPKITGIKVLTEIRHKEEEKGNSTWARNSRYYAYSYQRIFYGMLFTWM